MNLRKITMAVVLVMLAGCDRRTAPKPSAPPPPTASEVILSYLARPDWAGSAFDRQIIGEQVQFVVWDLDNELIYLALEPKADPDSVLSMFLRDPKAIEWAPSDTARTAEAPVVWGDIVYGGKRRLFRTKDGNFFVDENKRLHFPYQRADYELTIRELAAFSQPGLLYGGKSEALARPPTNGRFVMFINHGPLVAKPGEPTLARFTAALLKDKHQASREERIQALLDFLTGEIDYDWEQTTWDIQKLERPCEVLMRKTTICGNKAVLFGSLLEQIGEDYRLVYFPGHLSAAVERGAFAGDNGYGFQFEDKEWVIAETTCPGFKIGRSVLQTPLTPNRVTYIQDPSNVNYIYDAKSGKRVTFMPQ